MTTSKTSKKWPFCPAAAEHGRMVPYEPSTPEQAFCIEGGGRWLKCTQCTSSIIEQGSALTSFLATFKKSACPEETTMQPFPAEPDETTYAITVDPNDEAAERWFAQSDEADLTRTLASARDLARDLDFQLILRDAAGFIRGYVHNDGNYRMV